MYPKDAVRSLKELNLITQLNFNCRVLVTIETKYKDCFAHDIAVKIITLLVEMKVYATHFLVVPLENR